MKLTEQEILDKLETYKNYILSMSNDISNLKNQLAQKVSQISDLEKELEQKNSLLQNELIAHKKTENLYKQLQQSSDKLEKISNERFEEIRSLKEQLSNINIKSVVEKPVEKSTEKSAENDSHRRLVQFEQDDPVKYYKFGNARKSFADCFRTFIKETCPKTSGKFVNEPRIISLKLNLSPKTEQAFLDNLEAIEINKKPLIEQIGGSYYTNYSLDEILENVF